MATLHHLETNMGSNHQFITAGTLSSPRSQFSSAVHHDPDNDATATDAEPSISIPTTGATTTPIDIGRIHNCCLVDEATIDMVDTELGLDMNTTTGITIKEDVDDLTSPKKTRTTLANHDIFRKDDGTIVVDDVQPPPQDVEYCRKSALDQFEQRLRTKMENGRRHSNDAVVTTIQPQRVTLANHDLFRQVESNFHLVCAIPPSNDADLTPPPAITPAAQPMNNAAYDDGHNLAQDATQDTSGNGNGNCDGDDDAGQQQERIPSDEWTKERTSSNVRNSSNGEVGITCVHEQAPQINRRFYLGLDRPSVILRNARARRERRAARNRTRHQTEDGTGTDDTGDAQGGEGLGESSRNGNGGEHSQSQRRHRRQTVQTIDTDVDADAEERGDCNSYSGGEERRRHMSQTRQTTVVDQDRTSNTADDDLGEEWRLSQATIDNNREEEVEEGMSSFGNHLRRGLTRGLSMLLARVSWGTRENNTTSTPQVSDGGEYLINAVLVQEESASEIVMAEPIGFFERKSKTLAFATCFLLMAVVALISVVSTQNLLGNEAETSSKDAVGNAMRDDDESYCIPCINRTSYTIRLLLHDSSYDIQERFIPSARQSAKQMGVNLDVMRYPMGKMSDEEMADDIRSAANAFMHPDAPSSVNALIVDVPSEAVASAVRYAAGLNMPVFGVNSGFELAASGSNKGLVEDGSMKFFTAMDDRLGGELAASYLLQQFPGTANNDVDNGISQTNLFSEDYKNALFVSHKGPSESADERRFRGYRDRLMEGSNYTIQVERIVVELPFRDILREKLAGCMYQSVLVGAGSGSLFPEVMYAVERGECGDMTKIGSFGMHPEMGLAMMAGEENVDFVIDQSHHLHGWSSVQIAALYLTTGVMLAPPPGGVYLTGPTLLTKDNFTSGLVLSGREEEGGNGTIGLSLDRKSSDKKHVSIGGVVHGLTTEEFWDQVFSAANQSAIDMDIGLSFDRFGPQESNETLYKRMTSTILSLCGSGVDGLFVTLPDDLVVDAVRNCTMANPGVKIISINMGYEESKKLHLTHHIGMLEEDAGYQAGKRMANTTEFDKGICMNPVPGLSALGDRCKGFKRAMHEMGIEYLGEVEAQEDNITSAMLSAVAEKGDDEFGDWDGYGILLVGIQGLPAALELKKLHPNFTMGSFDTDALLYKSLQSGDVLFGIDQDPYLQGYLPVSLLTHMVTTKQTFAEHSIKTGPRFVTAPPSDDKVACKDRNFPVCSGTGKSIASPSFSPTVTVQPSSSMEPTVSPTTQPSSSMRPSSMPSFDMRPTLEIVAARGRVRCGLRKDELESGNNFPRLDLCRAVASVVFGNPDNVDEIPVTESNRFQLLNDRAFDLLISSDSHTIEREVRERTTGAGFTFSTPYYYDGVAYFGNATHVKCAEERKRYGDCSSLVICAIEKSTGQDFLQTKFPSEFFRTGLFEDMLQMLWNGTCNAIAADRSLLSNIESSDKNRDRKFIVGDKLMTKEPLAIVTRNADREFSDIINWVLNALFYGEEQELTKNIPHCHNYANLTSYNVFDLNFMRAVYCVGNYRDIFMFDRNQNTRGMNQINNGTGMLYATPFGELESGGNDLRDVDAITSGTLLDDIRKRGSLNCGVVGFDGDIATNLDGLSKAYCRTLAAGLFNGDYEAVKFLPFLHSNNVSFGALNNGTIDILAGVRIEQEYDFASSTSLQGFHFSTPYFYGNERAGDDVSFFSLATREDDVIFSSFVNCVSLATIYAQEKGVQKMNSEEMPSVFIFGRDFRWALRDAVAYSGSYGQIYKKYFKNVAAEDRGRNRLNNKGGPQFLSWSFSMIFH